MVTPRIRRFGRVWPCQLGFPDVRANFLGHERNVETVSSEAGDVLDVIPSFVASVEVCGVHDTVDEEDPPQASSRTSLGTLSLTPFG